MLRNVILLLLILTGTLWFWSLKRSSYLFVVKVRSRRIAFSRGRIPPRLLADVADIIEQTGVTDGEIRGVVRDGLPALQFRGEMSPGTQQQLRNLVGQYSVAQIRSGKQPR